MKQLTVKYTAPFMDYSGYGECSRHHIGAFTEAEVKVIGDLISYQSETSDYGKLGALAHSVKDNKGSYKIQLLHTTPDEFPRLVEPGKYHVGFCYWETDKIPQAFAEGLNAVDEIWTGSKANLEAIRKAGVAKPVKIFPEPLETDRPTPPAYLIPDFSGYLFYSIFEWTDRKNPKALVQAFLQEFKGQKDVGLLLKTYFRNFSYTNKKMIRNEITALRDFTDIQGDPPIFLYLDLMDRQQVMRIHATGNCFVSAHRGEGWGLPQVEAALFGKPIISTGYGGANEYFDNTSARLLPYKMVQLRGMQHSTRFYSNDQNWADVDIEDIKKAMRDAYERRNNDNKAKNGQKLVKERFNLKRVGLEMAERLKEIENKI